MENILKNLGYTLLAYPNPSMKPLSILERTNNGAFGFLSKADLQNMNADLFDIFEKDGILPKVKKPESVPNFGGHDVLENKASITANLLKNYDFAGNAKMASNVEKAKKLLYEFESPQKLFVNHVTLSEFLDTAKLKSENSDITEKVKKGLIYVVTEVLVTKKMTIKNGSSFGIGGKLSGNIVAEAELDVQANHNSEASFNMTYENEKPITFAIKVKKMYYNTEKARFTFTEADVKTVRGNDDEEDINAIDEEFIILE